jgi:Flp pilus assembly protein CpaB
VSRRARAVAFGCAALGCAALAATLAGGYRADLESQLGPLRPVLVARGPIPAKRALRAQDTRRLLEVRRVPERFAPAGALAAPEQAVGRAPAARIPAGAYVLGAQLETPGRRHRGGALPVGARRKPVEISVTGAEALAAIGRDPEGGMVDVIVTTEPGPGGGRGRTYVAAEDVTLLTLAQAAGGGSELPGAGAAGAWTATLALTRSQALHLIQAQNFARQVRLIPH